jgi:phosphoribosylaminoimidazole-succinocarboxamide synthase
MTFSEIATSLPSQAVTSIEGLPFPKIASGKVRELFDLGDALLMVATDRLSAFDVILPDGIPGKGIVLTQMSLWWFATAQSVISHHVLPDQASLMFRKYNIPRELRTRSMIVKKLKPVPMECVVRGYLAGSGWLSYEKTGEVCGIKLDPGLRQAERLPEPLFTPTTKGAKGQHDEALSEKQGMALLGDDLYREVQAASLRLYALGRERSARAGMILADTKFEFGTDANGKVYVIDELLTPDSSRYWPTSGYAINKSPPSFDKQFVRDYLLSKNWDQKPPAPKLPPDIIKSTQDKYLAALRNFIA